MLEAWRGVGGLAGSARTDEDWKLVGDKLAGAVTTDGRPLAVLTKRRLAGGQGAEGEAVGAGASAGQSPCCWRLGEE